ncbi:MAG: hypothetical protein KBC91_00750 [Candidatus Omnitrophica bacterium]|nr:hypothetical protein [Candidatus Omnitrophota bacterium]
MISSHLADTRPLVLIQGSQSAYFWQRQIADPASVRWVCYDPRAKAILESWGAEIRDDRVYFHKHRPELLELDAAVDRLCTSWYQGAPTQRTAEKIHPEYFFTLSVVMSFIGLLRAFYLLDYLFQEESGPVWITRMTPSSPASLRWSPEESAMPFLLDHLKAKWKISVQYYDLPDVSSHSPQAAKSRVTAGVLKAAMNSWRGYRRADVLFCGNPSLINAVRAELLQRGISSARLKLGSRFRDFLSGFQSDVVCLWYPQTPAKNYAFNAQAVYDYLKENGAFQFRGTDLLPVFWHKILPLYQENIPRALDLYEAAIQRLSKLRPKYLVVDEDATEAQRVLVCAANTLGIPTMVVLHGLPGSRFGFMPLEADRMAVWGDYCKKILQEWGIPEKRLTVTGCPKYDRLQPVSEAESAAAKRSVCDQFKLTVQPPLVLIILGGVRGNALEGLEAEAHSATGEILKTVRFFTEIARKIPQVNFICKFRLVMPNDLELFTAPHVSAGPLPRNMIFTSEGLALQTMKGADLVFSHFSSAVLEAVMIKKPVVQVNFSEYEDGFPFSGSGLGASVRTFEQALDLCRQLVQGTLPLQDWIHSQEQLVRFFLRARDGQAASRIADLLQQTMQTPKPCKTGGIPAGLAAPLGSKARCE